MIRFREYWHSREPREQLLLVLAAALLVILLLYLAWVPLMHQRDKLQRQLPQLREDAAQVRQIAAVLKQQQQPGSPGQDWRQAAQMLVSSHGWTGEQAKLLPGVDPATQHWQFTAVSASDFWNWLATLYRDRGVRVHQIDMKQAGTGQVTVDLELKHP